MKETSSTVQKTNLFVVRLFLRYKWRMLFFSFCIAVGIALLFSIQHLIHSFHRSVASQAKELMTADLSISGARPLGSLQEKKLQALSSSKLRHGKIIQMTSMIRGETKKKEGVLVILKGVDSQYPFYGKLEIEPKKNTPKLWTEKGCFVSKELSIQHGFQVGESVFLGKSKLKILGLIQNEPDQLFSDGIAPRVLLSIATLQETKLIQLGSRINYIHLIASSVQKNLSRTEILTLKKQVQKSLDSPYFRITSYLDAQPTLREVLKRVSLFFLFTSLVALLLGAIGMASSVTAFLNEQLPTVGTFRCLGFGPQDVVRLYNRLCIVIGLLGGLLGIGLGILFSYWGQQWLGQFLLVPLPFEFPWLQILEGLLIACVLTIGLNYLTIYTLSQLPPREILNGSLHQIKLSKKSLFLLISGFISAFYLYSLKISNSPELATFFTITVVCVVLGTLLLILLGMAGLSWMSNRVTQSNPIGFTIRHGLRQIVREKTRSLTFLLALTIGISFMASLQLVQSSLTHELKSRKGQSIPDLFLVDVQKDQKQGVKNLLKKWGKWTAQFNPLIRSRLTHINQRSIEVRSLQELTLEQRSRMRMLSREYNLTYKDKLNSSETIVGGTFWKKGEEKPQISIEFRLARRLNVKLNDTLTFDIQGRNVEGKITSIRKINWASLLPNFFVIFPRKVLEEAPQTFITSVIVKNEKARRAFQSQLGVLYPNITSLHIAQILKKVQGILVYLVIGMKLLAWICLAVGLILLAGTLSMGRRDRKQKIALFQSLGTPKKYIFWIDFIEFLGIGILTWVISLLFSYSIGWGLAKQMQINLYFQSIQIAEMALLCILLPVVIGLLSNRKYYSMKAMENLQS